MEEKLPLHEEEWQVVQCPSEHEEAADAVISAQSRMHKILESSLSADDDEGAGDEVRGDGEGGRPPDERVADEVDLSMVLHPKVDATPQPRPLTGPRVVCVLFRQSGVCLPHDRLKLQKLAHEPGLVIVDFFVLGTELGMLVGFDVPQRIIPDGVLVARHLLLLEPPFGKLDFVGKQVAASHDVAQTKVASKRAKAFASEPFVTSASGVRRDLDEKVVIGVAGKAGQRFRIQGQRRATRRQRGR